jgi:cytochrome c oxidase subunit 2
MDAIMLSTWRRVLDVATHAPRRPGALAAAAALLPGVAAAEPQTVGKAEPWQMGLQEAATPVMEQVQDFHNLLLVIITAITIFVLALLLYVSWRFHEKRNPTPSGVSHNTWLEIGWTAVPVIILVIIAIPSFKLLYYQDSVVDADMTVKAIGRQWYWSYAYPDHGDFEYNSFIKKGEDLGKDEYRQLSVDNPLVIPAKTDVRIQITASDVLHAFAVPAFGIKTDAVPGQLNETWARVKEPGMYYGMCSEICGPGHAEMPIAVKVVPKDEFDAWVNTQQAKHGVTPDSDNQLAEAGDAQ